MAPTPLYSLPREFWTAVEVLYWTQESEAKSEIHTYCSEFNSQQQHFIVCEVKSISICYLDTKSPNLTRMGIMSLDKNHWCIFGEHALLCFDNPYQSFKFHKNNSFLLGLSLLNKYWKKGGGRGWPSIQSVVQNLNSHNTFDELTAVSAANKTPNRFCTFIKNFNSFSNEN